MTQRTCLHRLVVVTVVVIGSAPAARADIFQWEYINPTDPSQGKRQSTTLAPDGAGVDAVPGANLGDRNLTMAYLIGVDLTGASGLRANLTHADLSQANLTNAGFYDATLTGADFTGAEVRRANFVSYVFPPTWSHGTGITFSQLYSTPSYQAHDLSGIHVGRNDLADGNFVGQNLTNADFYLATLVGADFTSADTRRASYLVDLLSSATTTNLIWPDGHINGLGLDSGGLLVVRDYDGDPNRDPAYFGPLPILVGQHLAMGPAGTLRMVFEADAWDSTISFAPGIPVTLGDTLELNFAADVNLASHAGRTFDLFDWTGVNPTGVFAVASPFSWDLSNLYTTGEVTLAAVPEPSSLTLALSMLALVPLACPPRVHKRTPRGEVRALLDTLGELE